MAQFVKGTTFEGKLDIVKKKCQCDIEGCDASFDFPSDLKSHKSVKHDIDVIWYHCDQCSDKFKLKGNLKRHLAFVHEIGVKWYHCEICDDKFKQSSHLKRHKAGVHDIDVQWFKCEICDKQFKTKPEVNRHKAHKHDIGVSWVKCEYCNNEFKDKTTLKAHLAFTHDIGVFWHNCEICDDKFKSNSHLKRHIQFVHDIGDHECDFCAHNRNSKIDYTDHCGTHTICRECFKKVTGKSSRIEIKWSDYLDENLGTIGLISSDKSLKSIGGCSLYRPDKLYLFQDTVELAECDENQHSGSSYSCDERRLSEIYEEEGIVGKFMYVIRWNPDSYFPKDNIKKKQKERFEIYVALVKKLRLLQHLDTIHIYYLFYSLDNENISQNLPFTHIHSMNDVENL